jgi:hypothetical protein
MPRSSTLHADRALTVMADTIDDRLHERKIVLQGCEIVAAGLQPTLT